MKLFKRYNRAASKKEDLAWALDVTVKGARNLPRMDRFGKCDGFVIPPKPPETNLALQKIKWAGPKAGPFQDRQATELNFAGASETSGGPFGSCVPKFPCSNWRGH